MTLQGTLEHVDVGMGAWVLVRADGTRVHLLGSVDSTLRGKTVTVTGERGPDNTAAMVDAAFTLVLSQSPSAS